MNGRKSLWLKGYDYGTAGGYFLTACTKGRQRLLSDIGPYGKYPALVRYFKRRVTQACGANIWQRSCYDHILRNKADCLRILRYLEENSGRWAELYCDECCP